MNDQQTEQLISDDRRVVLWLSAVLPGRRDIALDDQFFEAC
jgi:hypothetical protein